MMFAVYNLRTGEIDACYDVPSVDFANAQCVDGQAATPIAATVRDTTHYINPGTARANKRDITPCTSSRNEIPADGATAVTLAQMREGTEIQVAGPVSDIFTASGSEQLIFAVPGQYTITATAPFPARPKTVTIHAT